MFAILTILCVMVILFTGGCALGLVAIGLVPVAAVLAAIAGANVLVIGSLYGKFKPPGFLFLLLAGLDFLLAGWAVTLTVIGPADGKPVDAFDSAFLNAWQIVGGLAFVKGVLTVVAILWLERKSRRAKTDVLASTEMAPKPLS